MIKLNALELLEKSGHTRYWLYKQLGMSYQNRFNTKILRRFANCWSVLRTIYLFL